MCKSTILSPKQVDVLYYLKKNEIHAESSSESTSKYSVLLY